MRICKVYDDDYPWDVRVEKIGRALVEAGHQVALATRNRKRDQSYEYVDTMDVWRMPRISVLPPAVDVQLMFPAFFSPRWFAHIYNVAKTNRSDLILVRDIPLALTAIGVARALRKPVMLDMAENYPAALRAIHDHKTPSIVDLLVRNPTLAQVIEDVSLPFLDHTFVVCDENRERLLDKGVSPERVTVVGNTPDLDIFRIDDEVTREVNVQLDDAFVLCYIGAIDPFRGLDTLVEALPLLRQRIPKVTLAILGKGEGRAEVERHARRVGVADRVKFLGFRPLEQLPAFIKRADVSVIPHHRNEHIDTTLPNKLFDAMALGTPVLATDATPLRRIIEAEGCGLVYKSGDPESLAEKVSVLAESKRASEMGERGIRAARERYNWQRDSEALVSVVEAIGEGA
jgi:glycosyltransferase involved in cell wall biosynthesis